MSQESHPIKKNQNFFQLLVLIFIVGIFVGLDLLTKYILSSSSFFNGERLNLLPFLDIYVTQNSGIALSIFDYDQYWLSLTISIIGFGIVIYFASLALREKHLIKRVSTPISIATPVTMQAICSVTRVPRTTRVNTSFPTSSVPNQCVPSGG